jgi:dienelactone hydrolase
VTSSNLDIETPDGVANAYLARPDDEPHPGVLFVMDAFGLRPAIEQMVDRIAADGYLVLAPNVFYRGGRDRVAAVGAFHTGGLVADGDESPHHFIPDAELYLGFADEDPNATPEQIATLERALDDAGATYRSEVYAGAKHGFTQNDFPVYDEAATERHFRELRALLERTLV